MRKTLQDQITTRAVYLLIILFLLTIIPASIGLLQLAKHYEDPTVFWCDRIREAHLNYSCDWANDQLPRTAIKYWHAGYSIKQAHEKAIQETVMKEEHR